MFHSEVEGAVRRIEERVLALLVTAEPRGEAEAVRHLAPGNRHRLFQLPAPARMQTLDCRPRHVELFGRRPACEFTPLARRSHRRRAKSPSPRRDGRWDTRAGWSDLLSMKFRRRCARRLPRTVATATPS